MSAERASLEPRALGLGAGGGLGRRLLGAPEAWALAVLVLCFVAASQMSPYFWDVEGLLYSSSTQMELGVLALAMTIVIVNGDIDLSVGSSVAVCAAVLGRLYEAGAPIGVAIAAAVAAGAVLGLVNGLIVTRFRLPSLVVTLGTLALYRGVAEVLLTDRAISDYPARFVAFDQKPVLGTDVPAALVVFAAFAVVFAVLLHRTTYGRFCFAVGTNQEAARYSGVRVDRVRLVAFVLAGLMAGVAAVMMTSRLGSTRSNLAIGLELSVITVVVLGGTNIFGGRGSIASTVLALFAVFSIREGMALANVNGQIQAAVIGAILIASILLPNVLRPAGRGLVRSSPRPARRREVRPPGQRA